jgi:hypothetical protein
VKQFFTFFLTSILCTFLYGSLVPLAHAECAPTLTVNTPENPTTSTSFYFVASIQPDCGAQRFRIAGEAPSGSLSASSGEFTPTYTNGNFLQDVRLTLPEVGNWNVAVRKVIDPTPIGEVKVITITSEDNSQRPLTCGDVREGQLPSCSEGKPGECCPSTPANCPSTFIPELPGSAKWRCGRNTLAPGSSCNPDPRVQDDPQSKCPNGFSCAESQKGSGKYVCGGELPPEIEGRCNVEDNLIQRLPLCKGPGEGPTGKYKIQDHSRCGGEGKKGFVCSSFQARLCIQCPPGGCRENLDDPSRPLISDYIDPNNVKCETLPVSTPCTDGKCDTGLGISFTVGNPQGFINDLFKFVLMIASAAALLILIYAGYIYMTSGGDKTKIQGARETITSAIAGLLFLIFSITILEIIGVDILALPGFGR